MSFLAAIVDDEPWTMIDAGSSVDWERFGFRLVKHYATPAEALREIPSMGYTLVLVDIRMPGMDGLELIRRLKEEYSGAHYAILSGYSDFEYARAALRLGAEEYFSKPLEPDEIHAYLAKIAASGGAAEAAPQDAQFSQIVDYINLNLSSRLRLDDIADRFGYNRNYLSQLIAKKLGISFGRYVTRRRVESAKRLLAHTPLPASAVASRCGFSDELYFYKVFKREAGMTPAEYRQEARGEDGT